ncbi:glycosyltransferase family 92 protein [Yoonia maritima]|uniref:glycosyltransferase family 92 protein n=1 Tax=Yoonia maritima TaxID=1435347 RepID=UPI003736F677
MRIFRSQSKKIEATQFYIEKAEMQSTGTALALAVIVKNEASSIREWIEFHRAAGVDNFIIYDDGCTDKTITIARQLLTPESLDVIPWCQRLQDAHQGRALHSQGLAFAHAIANFRHRFRWMGFIDIDEFLFPTEANSIPDALAKLEHTDNILLPWHMFGRQGFAHTPERVLPNYTQRYRDPYASNVTGILNFKCIVNPSRTTKAYVHGFETSGNKTIWNSIGQKFRFGAHKKDTFHRDHHLQLNHYFVKSDEQLAAKIGKGSIGLSEFTKHFKNLDDRAAILTRRTEEIERDTVEDRAILDFCARIGFDPTQS